MAFLTRLHPRGQHPTQYPHVCHVCEDHCWGWGSRGTERLQNRGLAIPVDRFMASVLFLPLGKLRLSSEDFSGACDLFCAGL